MEKQMTGGEIGAIILIVGAFVIFGLTLGAVSHWSDRSPKK